jgi:hypothetical protein
MKSYDLSRQYYERSLELNADNDNARNMLDGIERGLASTEP